MEFQYSPRGNKRVTCSQECWEKDKAKYRRRWYDQLGGKEWARNHGVKRRYGVTADWVDERLAANKGCPICRTASARWVVDHDHATGRPRDVLCAECNVALGMAADSPDVLRRMVDYLEGRL